MNSHENTHTAITFDVAPDHGDWLETVRKSLAPADVDLFDLCSDRGFHLHPPSVLVHMGEMLDYNPEELHDEVRWMQAMTLVQERGSHASTHASAHFATLVDAVMTAMTPPHVSGPYVEVVNRDDGATWACSGFTFLDALYWATSTTQIAAIAFEHEPGKPFAQVSVNGPDLRDVCDLHVATDATREALARHLYENVITGREDVLRHLNASTDEHCHDLLVGTRNYPHHDLWELEAALINN